MKKGKMWDVGRRTWKGKLIQISLMLVCVSVFLYLRAVLLPAFATTYYIDAAKGNDSYDGTSESSAWKTIDKVNKSIFNPSDNIFFKRGEVWREQLVIPSSGSEGNPITFGAYGTGDKPEIMGTDTVTVWENYCGNIWKKTDPSFYYVSLVLFDGIRGGKTTLENLDSDQEFYAEWDSANQEGTVYIYSSQDPNTAYSNPGIEVGVRRYNIYGQDKSHITIQDLHLYGQGNNGGGDAALLFTGGKGHNILRNLRVERTAESGILIQDSSYNVVDNCEVTYFSVSGIGIGPSQWSTVAISYNTITNNQVWDGLKPYWDSHDPRPMDCEGYIGIGFSGSPQRHADHFLVRGNTVHDTGSLYSHFCDYSNISYNESYNNYNYEFYGYGFLVGSYNDIYQNRFYSNRGYGIQMVGNVPEGSMPPGENWDVKYNKIHHNLIYNNGSNGISIGPQGVEQGITVDGNEIYSNVIYGNTSGWGFGVHFDQSDGSTGKMYNNTLWGNKDHLGVSHSYTLLVKNNIFGELANCGDGYCYGLIFDSTKNVVDHENNLFWSTAGKAVLDYNNSNPIRPYSSSQVKTLFEPSAVVDDPKFVNTDLGDFRLQVNSPAIDKGVALAGIDKDFAGNAIPQGSAPDIGAFEYMANTILYGDVSGDSTISAYDASLAAQSAVGLITLTAEQKIRADVSGDGNVSAYDASLIAQKAAGLISKFPVEG